MQSYAHRQTCYPRAVIDLALRERICEANAALVRAGLVTLSFGNASGIDREAGAFAIKPSGVPCDAVQPEDLVVLSVVDGSVLEGRLRPSSDTPTHLRLYQAFADIGGVVHTHSSYAAAFAQAGRDIPCLGTTHADYFRGAVPVSRAMRDAEIEGAYEAETGNVIVETLAGRSIPALEMPAVLVRWHGPFAWGQDALAASENAVALEAVATMAGRTLALEPGALPAPDLLVRRHFDRKHGPGAYYGQPGEAH